MGDVVPIIGEGETVMQARRRVVAERYGRPQTATEMRDAMRAAGVLDDDDDRGHPCHEH